MTDRRPPRPPPKEPLDRDERSGNGESSHSRCDLASQLRGLRICRSNPRFASNRASVMSTASTASNSTTASSRSNRSRFSVMSSASSVSSVSSTPPPSYHQSSRTKLRAVPPTTSPALAFQNILFTLSDTPVRYENAGLLDEALRAVPVETIFEEADFNHQLMQAEAASLGTTPEFGVQECMVKALLKWFKNTFFHWISTPKCKHCGHETVNQGAMQPTPDEKARGAGRTEIFICADPACGEIERFPRYSDVWTLMQTRRGRCGEWANCFTMLCRAMGWRARWVWNSEDHVWTEVWSETAKRWCHVDACEEAFDRPMMYADNWKKRLGYCIAFSHEGATDVTRRYVRNRREHGRPRERCTEENLVWILNQIRNKRRERLSAEDRRRCEKEDEDEELELRRFEINPLRKLKEKDASELGRTSGTADWIRQRGEDGMGQLGGGEEMFWQQDGR